MADKWIVLKFGGTSVAGRLQWKTIAELAQARRAQGYRVLLVCSAVSGITNRLESLADTPSNAALLSEILDLHRSLGQSLGIEETGWLPEAEVRFKETIGQLLDDPHPKHRAALLAQGEWLSTWLGAEFLKQQLDTGWVDAREALEVETDAELSAARQWLSASCAASFDDSLARQWSGLSPVLITQGFVGRTRCGGTALLGRGGSDTSAALMAGRLAAECVEIWTDVPGLFSADPRHFPTARLLAEVDYTEALEMAASGARVIHPRCIRAAAALNIPLLIRDLNRPQLEGTRVGAGRSQCEGVKTITCQQHMAVLLLENLDTRQQVGFLARVFDVFRRQGVSIDLVATSETTTTVSVNCAANHLGPAQLEQLAHRLRELCRVELFTNCVCVNLVGRGARTALAKLSGVMRHFDDHPLLMVSQSANDMCLSLLVREGDHQPLLAGAHDALIPQGPEQGGMFGASWEAIEQS